MRLAEKEESMLEKDLIFEQVCRLVDRVHKKADTGKSDTLHLAKNVSMQLKLLLMCSKKPLKVGKQLFSKCIIVYGKCNAHVHMGLQGIRCLSGLGVIS